MSHGHDHSHHSHYPQKDFRRAYAVGVALNVGFVVAEIAFGFAVNSLALLSDAGHNAGDVLGLCLAWGAACLAKRKPSARYTYGLQGSSILAALANAVLLLVACGGIAVEAVRRLWEPQPVDGSVVMAVAAVGIAVNGGTALLFWAGRSRDLNVRGAFLHMAADAAVSLGVVISGLAMIKTGWGWLDPVISLVIAAVILVGTWGLLREAVNLALHAAPGGVDPAEVRSYLCSRPGVCEVHDLHIWAMSTDETALSAHLVIKERHPGDAFLRDVERYLEHEFGIGHVTLQIEIGDCDGFCKLASDDVP